MRLTLNMATGQGSRVAAVTAIFAIWLGMAGCGKQMSGRYQQVDGAGSLEFKGRRVYVTTVLNTVLVADYELDGDRVIIRGSGGSQVYMCNGDTIDAGMGIQYVKQ